MPHYIKQFEPLWGKWKVEDKVGAGSYGSVWKVSRSDGENVEYAAIKEIIVPASKEILYESKLQGLNPEMAKLYFRQILDDTLLEVQLMRKLSKYPNIVHFEKYQIRDVPFTDDFGWVVLIWMEFLQPVRDIFLNQRITIRDVAKIGIDICCALEACEENQILHRDIKPDNIFYDPKTNQYKLGDFGIAREQGRATADKGRPGTLSHMPPEVYQGERFSYGSDLYALGMILYRLLNYFRLPFLPPYPQPFTPHQRDQALLQRLNGAEPELPQMGKRNAEFLGASKKEDDDIGIYVDVAHREQAIALGEIVRKSISAKPNNRFQNARQLRIAIEEVGLI
jgi:serine/threonine-protein kinase